MVTESPDTHAPGNTMLRGDADTPFKSSPLTVTPEQAEGIRAFIRELKPGVYLKCSRCEKMKIVGHPSAPFMDEDGSLYCEACA